MVNFALSARKSIFKPSFQARNSGDSEAVFSSSWIHVVLLQLSFPSELCYDDDLCATWQPFNCTESIHLRVLVQWFPTSNDAVLPHRCHSNERG